MKTLCLMLLFFSLQTISAQSVDEMIKDLGITKKGKMALNIKPESSFSKTKLSLLKNKPRNLFYDEVENVFSLTFTSIEDSMAEITFIVKNDVIVGCSIRAFITSSAKINEFTKKIEALLNKSYDSPEEGVWIGKGLYIDFFDSSDGFNLDFAINQ